MNLGRSQQPLVDDLQGVPESSLPALSRDGRQRAPSRPWGRFLGLVAAAVVVALLASVLLQLANQRGRPTGPLSPHPTAETQLTATAVSATATPTRPAGPVVTGPIDEITMFSATTGWGSVPTANPNIAGGIAYTVDGGHTWYNVTPAGLTLELPFTIALYPRSATEAWAWLSLYGGGSSTTLWHTTDGGTHWSTANVPTGAVRQLDFSDSLHGWLTATPFGAAAGLYPIDVWRTTDGGATWIKVGSYPVAGSTTGISFANAATGFALGCPLGSAAGGILGLCVTHDAGNTWSALSLPTPPGYVEGDTLMVELPVFTSPTTGVLEVG